MIQVRNSDLHKERKSIIEGISEESVLPMVLYRIYLPVCHKLKVISITKQSCINKWKQLGRRQEER